MWKLSYPRRLRKLLDVLWAEDKSIFMMKWFGMKTENKRIMSQQAWWMSWWDLKRSAIIQICFSPESNKVLLTGYLSLLSLPIICFSKFILKLIRLTFLKTFNLILKETMSKWLKTFFGHMMKFRLMSIMKFITSISLPIDYSLLKLTSKDQKEKHLDHIATTLISLRLYKIKFHIIWTRQLCKEHNNLKEFLINMSLLCLK